MRHLLALAIALLPACAATPPATEQGVAVVWNRVEEPHRACESLSGRKNFYNILGCSHWEARSAQGGPRVCAIYAPEPRSERDLQRFATLGHELMHCFDGNWHDKWGRMNPPGESTASNTAANAAAGGSAARQAQK